MIAYQYDDDGVYVGIVTAQMSPREPDVCLIPAQSTDVMPPATGRNECAVWENGKWTTMPDFRGTVYWLDDGTKHEINEIGVTLPLDALEEPPVIKPSPEELQAHYCQLAQDMMDARARERNYDGIMSVCSYATSSFPKFATEAAACVAWRDAVWAKCYELLDAVKTGGMDIPSEEDFLGMLPAFVWPDERTGEAGNGQTV